MSTEKPRFQASVEPSIDSGDAAALASVIGFVVVGRYRNMDWMEMGEDGRTISDDHVYPAKLLVGFFHPCRGCLL